MGCQYKLILWSIWLYWGCPILKLRIWKIYFTPPPTPPLICTFQFILSLTLLDSTMHFNDNQPIITEMTPKPRHFKWPWQPLTSIWKKPIFQHPPSPNPHLNWNSPWGIKIILLPPPMSRPILGHLVFDTT